MRLFEFFSGAKAYEGLMDELAEWMWSDTCALEGCENSLLGYKSNAFYCCPAHTQKAWHEENEEYWKAYQKEYQQTPEYKAYRESPEYKAYQKAYDKARSQTPEYKARKKAYRARKKAEANA